MNLFERISMYAKRKKISIAQIEKSTGLGNGTIRRWGGTSPSSDRLIRVAKLLSLPTDTLLGLDEISNVGWAIKKEREEQKITPKTIKFFSEVIEDELKNYENDSIPISEYVLRQICMAFDKSLSSFYKKYNISPVEISSSHKEISDELSEQERALLKTYRNGNSSKKESITALIETIDKLLNIDD